MYILFPNRNIRHGHGFILAINIQLHGYVNVALTLLIVTFLSSNGALITSNVCLLNSGNSSKNNTPKCAKLISPWFWYFTSSN